MSLAGVVILALVIAAIALVLVELSRTRSDALIWAVFLLALADLLARIIALA